MANRQARREARKGAARFSPQPVAIQPRLHPGLLPRTRDLQRCLAFLERVYGPAPAAGAKEAV